VIGPLVHETIREWSNTCQEKVWYMPGAVAWRAIECTKESHWVSTLQRLKVVAQLVTVQYASHKCMTSLSWAELSIGPYLCKVHVLAWDGWMFA